MKFSRIFLIAGAFSVLATPAFAGTSVTNSTSIRKSSGTGHVNTTFTSNVTGYQINQSQSLKMESYGGDVNIANVNFNGYKLTGNAHSSNNVPIDPVAIGTYSSQYERLNITETVNMNAVENYSFTEKVTDHTVSSDSF